MKTEMTKKDLKDFLLNSSDRDFADVIEYMHPVDILDTIHECSEEEVEKILNRLSDEDVADLLEEEDDEERYDFLKGLSAKRQHEVLEEMSSDERADFVGALNETESKDVLSKLTTEDKQEVTELLKYDPETAGGLMATEYITIRDNRTVLKTLEYLQTVIQDAESIYYLYVTDRANHLKGVIALRDLVSSPFDKKISEITNPNVVSVNVKDDQETVANVFDKYDYMVLPVVDDQNVLKGVITVDDVIDVIKEETNEDFNRMAGLGSEEKVDDTLPEALRSRLPWLVINLATAVLAAACVAKFSATIEAIVALAAINPIIAGMGGNAGTQSLTLIVRGIALGELDKENGKKIFFKEFGVGLLSGAVIGAIVAVGCQIFYHNWYLGLVTFLAMVGNMVVATVTGFLVPVILKKVNIDPALASTVFVTTFTDCCGFLLFLGLATAFLPKLV
jgi:magnesium transporter